MMPHLALLWQFLGVWTWVSTITQPALCSLGRLRSLCAQCSSDFGLLDFGRCDSKTTNVVNCCNLMVWETLTLSQSQKPLAGKTLLVKFALERRPSVASIRPVDEERGGPAREAIRSEEEVDLIYGTQGMGEVAWTRETQWCLEGDLG